MKNRWLLNLALLLVIGLLVVLVVFKPGTKTDTGLPLTALTAENIQKIRLLRPKQPEIVFEKSGEAWRLTAPRTARANDFRVNELVRLASQRVPTHFPAVPAELDKFGLVKPFATIIFNDTEIRLGATHPINNEIYVLAGDTVALVSASLQRTANAALEEWLSPNLLGDKAKIASLRLPSFSLRQNERGGWVRTPELKDLSSGRIARFVDEWRYARALTVTPANGPGGQNRITVKVQNGEKQTTIEFAVIARSPELVLRRLDEGLDYRFPPDIGERLLELRPDEAENAATPANATPDK